MIRNFKTSSSFNSQFDCRTLKLVSTNNSDLIRYIHNISVILYTVLYSYTHTHPIKNSCDIHTTGGQLLQGVDITIQSCIVYLILLLLQ